jgi:hypothetical protein
LQIEPVRWRATLAGCTVTVHQHLHGTFTITHGPQRLGHYSAEGVWLENEKIGARGAVEKTQVGKVLNPTFPPCLEIPQTARDSHFATASAAAGLSPKPDISLATKTGHFNLLPTTWRGTWNGASAYH